MVTIVSLRRKEIRLIATTLICAFIQRVETISLFSNRCRLLFTKRCGFLQLGSLIRYGEQGAEECIEKCSYTFLFEDRGYTCGSCTVEALPAPTVAPLPSSFGIYLDLDIPVVDRALFRRARDTWTNIIRSELVDIELSELSDTTPLDGNCVYPEVIDDTYICCQYIDIDGAGKVVGRTTILAIRDEIDDGFNNGLPISARIRLDNADIDTLISGGNFQDVIEHEIAHALGFGILWGTKGLITQSATGGSCEYTGPNAIAEYSDISGCDYIPTTCGHWDEDCFGREIMTDTIDITTVVSRVTVASMEDLGYEVDYSYADQFSQVDISVYCLLQCPKRNLMDSKWGNNVRHPIDISNGITRRRRRLSDKGYANAVQHGQAVLEQESSLSAKQPKNSTIYILYMEENELYSIPVQLD
jgi:hypothetical protein